jgi:cell division protein FtsB
VNATPTTAIAAAQATHHQPQPHVRFATSGARGSASGSGISPDAHFLNSQPPETAADLTVNHMRLAARVVQLEQQLAAAHQRERNLESSVRRLSSNYLPPLAFLPPAFYEAHREVIDTVVDYAMLYRCALAASASTNTALVGGPPPRLSAAGANLLDTGVNPDTVSAADALGLVVPPPASSDAPVAAAAGSATPSSSPTRHRRRGDAKGAAASSSTTNTAAAPSSLRRYIDATEAASQQHSMQRVVELSAECTRLRQELADLKENLWRSAAMPSF